MKQCEPAKHKWISVREVGPWGFEWCDKCEHCGSYGELSKKPDENGFYQIVARPVGKVINLADFRKRKELQNGTQTANTDGTGSNRGGESELSITKEKKL